MPESSEIEERPKNQEETPTLITEKLNCIPADLLVLIKGAFYRWGIVPV